MLLPRLNDSDPDVRTLAAHLLGVVVAKRFPHEEHQERAAEQEKPAQPDPESIRLKTQAIEALIAALEDPDNQVRWVAAIALGRIGPAAKSAVPSLIALARDRAQHVDPGSMIVLTSVWAIPPSRDCRPGYAVTRIRCSRQVRS